MRRNAGALGFIAMLLLVAGCGAETDADITEEEQEALPAATESQQDAEEDASQDNGQQGAEDAGDESETDGETQEEANAAEETPGHGEARGVVTVDGITYEITEVRACEPLDDGTVERELELQGLGDFEGDRLQIDVYVQTVAGMPFDDVSWAGPEGIFGGPDDADVTVADGGASVSGTATLHDAATHTETVQVEFDLEVPDEEVACR